MVVPFVVGGSPAVGKAQGAEEGDDDEKKNGLDVHCMFVCICEEIEMRMDNDLFCIIFKKTLLI